MAPPLSPETFREEAARRLIDTFELMTLSGLRSRAGIEARTERGALPEPVFSKQSAITLWDRDDVEAHLARQG